MNNLYPDFFISLSEDKKQINFDFAPDQWGNGEKSIDLLDCYIGEEICSWCFNELSTQNLIDKCRNRLQILLEDMMNKNILIYHGWAQWSLKDDSASLNSYCPANALKCPIIDFHADPVVGTPKC